MSDKPRHHSPPSSVAQTPLCYQCIQHHRTLSNAKQHYPTPIYSIRVDRPIESDRFSYLITITVSDLHAREIDRTSVLNPIRHGRSSRVSFPQHKRGCGKGSVTRTMGAQTCCLACLGSGNRRAAFQGSESQRTPLAAYRHFNNCLQILAPGCACGVSGLRVRIREVARAPRHTQGPCIIRCYRRPVARLDTEVARVATASHT